MPWDPIFALSIWLHFECRGGMTASHWARNIIYEEQSDTQLIPTSNLTKADWRHMGTEYIKTLSGETGLRTHHTYHMPLPGPYKSEPPNVMGMSPANLLSDHQCVHQGKDRQTAPMSPGLHLGAVPTALHLASHCLHVSSGDSSSPPSSIPLSY